MGRLIVSDLAVWAQREANFLLSATSENGTLKYIVAAVQSKLTLFLVVS